jgi:hypothetical protein
MTANADDIIEKFSSILSVYEVQSLNQVEVFQ